MAITLPTELTDEIIDYLHDDKRALSSCCRVCKGWIERSRRYLWRRITVDSTHETSERLALFLDLMRTSPLSMSYIAHLELSLLDYHLADRIIAQLPSLPCLESLSMNYMTVRSVPHDVVLSSSMKKLAVSQSTFYNMLDWHNLVVALPNLEDLKLGPFMRIRSLKRGTERSMPKTDFVLRLHRLNVDFVEDLHPAMLCWLAEIVHSVETDVLRVKEVPNNFLWTEHFWYKCMPAVHTLEIDGTTHDFSFGINMSHINLSLARNLRTVVLYACPSLFPFHFATLSATVLTRLPKDVQLDQFLIVLGESSRARLHLRDTWFTAARDLVTRMDFTYLDFCAQITIRAQHPMQWNVDLLTGVEPLRKSIPALRLEYADQDGQIHPMP